MMLFKNKNGFTLVELVTVTLLIGVISAIAIPNIISWLPELRLKSAARNLYSEIVNVRMNAIKENKSWAVVFDTANNRFFTCDDWGADGSWTGAGDTTGTGDNSIVATFCVDGSEYRATDPQNCSQRVSGVVFGSGDATVSVPGGAIPASGVSYTNSSLVFNNQGTGNTGYVYIENQDATTSFSVGTLASGVVRVLKSAEGVADYDF